jgi:type II secretory pathway component HofQ
MINADQYRTLKIAARVAALERAVALYSILARAALVNVESELRSVLLSEVQKKISHSRATSNEIVFPDLTPEQSDMFAAEAQEAIEQAMQEVESFLGLFTH